MIRSASVPITVFVIFTLLTTLALSAARAQPAPPPPTCPEGEVFVPEQNACVPADQVPTQVPTAVIEPTPLPEGNLASFTLYHLTCDNDFDPNGVRDAGGLGSANGCLTFGKPPFTYTISANGIPIATATLEATERDFARYDVTAPIPAGTLTIAVAPVAPYTTEFISCGLEVGEAGTDIIEPTIAGGSATFSTLPDQKVECWVYNVNPEPENQNQGAGEEDVVVVGDGNTVGTVEVDESNTVDTSANTGATITIAAYLCPAGVTATDDLIAACTQRASGLAFSLLTANETLETQTSDAEGDIFYSGVPANEYGIAAALPAGYGEPIVICYVADPIGNVFEGQRDVVFGNQIRLQLGDNFSAECAWYNVPAAGPDNGPNVYIQARKCGAGISIAPPMTVYDAEQLCGVVYQNKPFQVQLDGQVLATKQTNDDPLSSGQVFFTKLPAPNGGGVYGITTTMAEGERVLGVFCDQNYGGDRFVTVTTNVVDGNRVDQELLEGWTLRCSWFIDVSTSPVGTIVASAPADQPALDPTSEAATQQAATQQAAQVVQPAIRVLARLCPPEVVTEQVNLDAVCTVPAVGVTFDIAIGGEPSITLTTDEVRDLDIPLGVGQATYQIATRPDPGLSEAEVSCTTVRADGTVQEVGGTVPAGAPGQEIVFDGASEVTCVFYFLGEVLGAEAAPPVGEAPAPPEDAVVDPAAAPHTLTVAFWTCPAGTDPATDQVNLVAVCSTETEERAFTLAIDGDSIPNTVTGGATWEFLDPTIAADIGPGVVSSAWCTTEWAEVEGETIDIPDSIALEAGVLTITVARPQTAVYCDWYLFPE